MNRRQRIKNGKIRGLLVLVFLLSFLQYFLPIKITTLLVPVSLLTFTAHTAFVFSNPARQGRILTSLLAPGSLFFVLTLPLLPTIVSLFCGRDYSVFYGCLMILTLSAIRVILSVTSIEDVLSSYFYASAIAIPVFTCLAARGLLDAITGDYRLALFSFHPNLIAFLIAGFIPVQLWRFRIASKNKGWISALIFIGLLIVFFSSSRGSIVAILTGTAAVSIVYFIKQISTAELAVARRPLFYAMPVLALATSILIVKPQIISEALSYIADKLDLFSPYRGLNTGLSGRIERWNSTLYALEQGSWLLGNGYRSGSPDLGFSIDNGYLTLVYEIGLFPAIFVTAKYIWVTLRFVLEYLRSEAMEGRALYLSLAFVLVVFLTNNIVVRYLFGVGNPFSLLALFFLLLRRNDIDCGGRLQRKRKRYGKIEMLPAAS